MKNILGLDLGTNSIGWALVEQDFKNKQGKIIGMGSRIIPMTQDLKDEFGKGNSISQTAERTNFRGIRRLRERHLLRRERLHRVLNILNFLPYHYADKIDFEYRLGKFSDESEPKLAYHNNEFVFKDSFNEMLEDFKINQPELLNRKNQKGEEAKIPYDWTIYYLRKKALSKKIEKEELAWIILNFNQKRGYYQLRGEEEEENPNKLVEFHSLKITDVIVDEVPNKKGDLWYSMYLENGWIYRRSSKIPLFDWVDKVRNFIVTTDLNDDGTIKTDKDGVEKRSFRAPSEDDWTLVKKKTEQEIEETKKTVGTYIYDTLLENPNQKIKGKLVRTIERKFYKEELIAILKKQIELQSELFTETLLNESIRELYRNNEVHQQLLSNKDFIHLFVNDIIFYQRPLRSQKSSIGNCSLEYRKFKVKNESGNEIYKTEYLKGIPKSHPLYQEFRLWQWIYNLKIHTKEDDKDVTIDFIQSLEDIEKLFEFLNGRKGIKQDTLIKFLVGETGLKGKALSDEVVKYRWNFVEGKEYPSNETGSLMLTRLAKVDGLPKDFLTKEIENKLWHLIYSVTDKIEFEKALKSFANKHNIDEESFVENFKRFPPFKSEYGSFSEKAIKKLLPLLRIGKYWNWEDIDLDTQKRIDKIITGEYDENIKNRVREKAIHLQKKEDFQGLQLWLAQYIIYDRHSEAAIVGKWNTVTDLEKYITEFKQHSLRNPIVEQIITETLRVVKDIWSKYGNGEKDFFSEIHVELGREMKNTADERKKITNRVTENENTNLRIKTFLSELLNDPEVKNVRPYSPMQQEALKIFEDGILNSGIEIPDDISKISKLAQPTKSEFQRYKLWLEQKYKSPYTGQPIPLSKLFTTAYEIEHVIPQSRFFDDSFTNKVICESAVNKLKDKQLGLEFIKNHQGTIVETGFGETVKVLSEDAYQEFIKEHYKNNRSKRNKLLMDEIPEKMIERQMNDTRYISKFISNLLSNIVRSDSNDEGINSKNLLPGNGKITTTLKQDWGLNDVWNDLILPRFERMNQLTNSNDFTAWNEKHQKHLPTVPLGYSKGFQKKRIDHRHHAMDALVVACATREHVNLLNNQSAKSDEKLNDKSAKSDKNRYNLQHSLRRKESYFNEKENRQKDAFKEFIKPWETFTQDARNELEKIVVSFKQNLRVINKTTNRYESYKDENGELRLDKDGKPKKGLVLQTKGDSWAIRKPMHKDTVSGEVQLARIKVPKGSILTATRKSLDTSYDLKRIETITDTGIQKILRNYLTQEKFKVIDNKGIISYQTELAFSPEGIEDMNKNIEQFNNGKKHQPIYKVRVFEAGSKFALGQTGNKKTKYVEAAKGTNLFFAIYQDEDGKRSYETIPLNVVIERQKQGLGSVPELNEKGHTLLFHLSPNDLVYVPADEETETNCKIDFQNLSKEQTNRIYKMVSSTGKECHFIHSKISSLIKNYDAKSKIGELGSLNKLETTSDNSIRIKEKCIKLNIDRLGNISKSLTINKN